MIRCDNCNNKIEPEELKCELNVKPVDGKLSDNIEITRKFVLCQACAKSLCLKIMEHYEKL